MIVDSHTHILPLEITKNIPKYSKNDSTLNELFNPRTKTSTAEALIDSMDELGIEISVVMGMDGSFIKSIRQRLLVRVRH